MDIFHVRTQRYTIQSFNLLIEESAFQSRMDRNDCRFLSVHFLVNRYHFVTERGIFAVFPCRISTLNFVFSTEELGQEEQPAKETPAEPVTPSEPTTETPADNTTSAKPNPETGAEDFVGLAVSLAVVSVAAAGALALKK